MADNVDRIGMLKLFECLAPREHRVLALRFGLNGVGEHTLVEVGQQQNLTAEAIRQIEKKALRKLKGKAYRMHAQSADDYVLPN